MDAREHIIVCGVDGSPAAQRALEWAIAEARYRQCTLRVVTAWSWDGVEGLGAPGAPGDARAVAEKVQRQALLAATEGLETSPVIDRRLVQGRPSEVLCTAALDAELLVVGGQGHTAVREVLVGSTSQRVIRHAACPVVVLPDPQHVAHELKHARRHHRRTAAAPPSAPMF